MSSRIKLKRKAAQNHKYTPDGSIDSDSSGFASEEDHSSSSSRKKRKSVAAKEKDLEGEEETKSNNKKRKKNQKSARKGKKNKPQVEKKQDPLERLPFELVSEILSHTTPKDLLSFSRTNKHYRSILMSKARSNQIWKTSRRNVGLPDLTAGDFSEPAYAALIFGTRCDHCSRYAPAWMDPYLRRRLCKPCRKAHIVKINRELDRDQHYHPATLKCVVRTSFSPSDTTHSWYSKEKQWTLRTDLDSIHKKLSILQEDDEYDEELEVPPQIEHSRFSSGRHRRQAPRHSSRNKNAVSYKEEKDDLEDEEIVIRIGGRVEAFIQERKELLDKIYADAAAIKKVFFQVHKKIKEDEAKVQYAPSFAARQAISFRYSVENRLARTEGYSRSDAYLLSAKKLSSITSTEQALTDKLWKSIESKVLAVVDKEKQKQLVKAAKEKVLERQASRQRSLRSYYDQLKSSLDDSTFFPLFIDFLLLPSVKPLWQNDEGKYRSIDDSDWKLLLPLIKDEIEEYHLDFITHAVRLVLSTNNEYSSEEDLEDAVQATLEGDLDSFFSLASSLVMCGGGCRGQKQRTAIMSWNGRIHWQFKKQGGMLGTLHDVFSHLHQVHNDSSVVEKRQATPLTRLCLPLHVASAISALIEVGRYSSDEARVNDLDLLNSGWFRYENSRSNHKNFKTWQKLINRISLDAHKAERARPPVDLPAPLISFHPSSIPPPQVGEKAKVDSDDDE
ncbi:hypothetical protein JCM3765_000355 [Sporobolomyces pararoseus]